MTTPPNPPHAHRFSLGPLLEDTLWLDEVDSTNRYLAAEVQGVGPVAVASWNQRAGRGRMARPWHSPANQSLALSIRVWPELTPDRIDASWLGAVALLAGDQLVEAVGGELRRTVGLKWPNDVEIDGKKLAGILGELTPHGQLILGVGINVWIRPDELPTDRSTSLFIEGMSSPESLERILQGFIEGLRRELAGARRGLSDSQRDRIHSVLTVFGERVRVEYPDGTVRLGVARGIDSGGRLEVFFDDSARLEAVDAADVWHLRADATPDTDAR